ncbi:MAG: hypothetical protein PUE13_08575, partial [Clostridiales bacterium]|nr:hypothetical protein [Clostridiales bacterium]
MSKFMIINTENGQQSEIMGKYMYYSFPRLIVKTERVKEICEQIGFPVSVSEKGSITDAFKSATSNIYDRIEQEGNEVLKIYCRDNKRGDNNILSRELVEETLMNSTNNYRKLANITLDKEMGIMQLSGYDLCRDSRVIQYFDEANNRFSLYRDCVSNSSIENMVEKYMASLHAISISAKGHHYFVPKDYMHKIDLLETFFELLAKENLFVYADGRNAKYFSSNSMYVADDETQRKKMAHEFYFDMGREIEEYQKNISRLIRNGNSSQRILDRWTLKIEELQRKKREYESLLKQNLSGIDENFTLLEGMREQLKLN